MGLFRNKNLDGHEVNSPEVKPKNQILQTPEKNTFKSKGKLDKYQNKPPEERENISNNQKEIAKKFQKLKRPDTSSTEGDPSKGQREREQGHTIG